MQPNYSNQSTPSQPKRTNPAENPFKNDYNLHFIESGERPQNFIRDTLAEERFQDYPKLNELIKLKDQLIQKKTHPPIYIKSDLKTFDLRSIGKFDVILVDPPWEEYARRMAQYGIYNENPWSYEEIADLNIDDLADTPSFVFLWVGSENLDTGRALFRKWGFKRIEDIVWLKTNKQWSKESKLSAKNKNRNNGNTLLQCVKEHCLVGLKGDVKRASDSYFIHANIDTDIIVDEEQEFGSTAKPKEIYEIIERFCLGRRRIELFGGSENIRKGWLTIGNALPGTKFNLDEYESWINNDRFIGTTAEIENLRPKSPKSNNNMREDTRSPMGNGYHMNQSPNMKNMSASPGMNMDGQGYQGSGYKYSGVNQSPGSMKYE